MDPNQGPCEMPASRWSLIAAAHGDTTTARRRALDELLRLYYAALRAHLVLSMRLDAATADDVIQGFIADKILDRDLLAAAHPSKGRFRSLLLRSLTNYAIDVLRKRRSQAIVGPPASFEDFSPLIEPVGETPVDPFDVAWAREVLAQALRTMRAECDAQGCAQRWSLFQRRVLRPLFHDKESPAYSELVDEFQFASPQQASNALITAKRHFQRVLVETIGEYAEGDEAVAAELADLQTIFRRAGSLGTTLDWATSENVWVELCSGCDNASAAGHDLARLLATENHVDSIWDAQDYAGLWRHVLHQRLSNVLTKTAPDDDRLTATVNDVLQDAKPPLDLLVQLKESARDHVRFERSELPAEIATALYFTSIAVAIVKCQTRISKSDDVVLDYGFQLLAARSWLDEGTRQLVVCALNRN